MGKYSIEVDTHTHTVISGHAFSTLHENILQAKKIGLKGICHTEHSEAMPGSGPFFLIDSFSNIPLDDEGIKIYRGIEADVIDPDGTICPDERFLKKLDFCIASIHESVTPYKNYDIYDYTQTYLNVVKNPYVSILGHIDRGRGTCDFETVVLAAKENDKLIEINNTSLRFNKKDGLKKMGDLISICKKHSVPVCVSSDSHYYTTIGEVGHAMGLLEELEFPEELIMNRSKEVFDTLVEKHRAKMASL